MKSSTSTSTATAPIPRPNFEISDPGPGATLVDITNGKAMHSRIGPAEEARIVYIEPSGLISRITGVQEPVASEPLILYDVGLGIAANAIAALDLYLRLGSIRPFQILSFENDMEGLATALAEIDSFPFLIPHREALESLISTKQWQHPNLPVTWKVFDGDFRKRVEEDLPPPEIIFYDFYAPSFVPVLWSVQLFSRLRTLAAPRLERGLETILCTYSAATPVRLGLLLSGFFVGSGNPTGEKLETTIASTLRKGVRAPLDLAWLKRKREGKKALPYGIQDPSSESARVWASLSKHPQF